MPDQAKNKKSYNDFGGLYLLSDPMDLPPGAAQDQVNIKSDEPGQMEVRGGMLPVSFDVTTVT